MILAGGSGQRFWPLSREDKPKHLLALFEGRTLLEMAVERALALAPRQQVWVVTQRGQLEAARQLLPQLGGSQFLIEPMARNTAAALSLAAAWVMRLDPQAELVVLAADHHINPMAAFVQTIERALVAARQHQALVTVAVRPTWACPSFGYLECGEALPLEAVLEVKAFHEKPHSAQAAQFLQSGKHRWNAGMFIWGLPTLLAQLQRHAPAYAELILQGAQAEVFDLAVEAAYPTLPRLSIDHALMEKAAGILAVEASFQWDDLGHWSSLAAHLPADGHGNAHEGRLAALESQRNLVFCQTGQQVALVGVDDLIVVSTADALLVTRRDKAEELRKLVAGLPPELR